MPIIAYTDAPYCVSRFSSHSMMFQHFTLGTQQQAFSACQVRNVSATSQKKKTTHCSSERRAHHLVTPHNRCSEHSRTYRYWFSFLSHTLTFSTSQWKHGLGWNDTCDSMTCPKSESALLTARARKWNNECNLSHDPRQGNCQETSWSPKIN